jgi:DNA transposition AAA+ family ATPase
MEMKKHFVKNANYRRFMTGITRIERRGAEESSLILVYGPPGVGKTRTVNHYGAMTDAITVPGMHGMNVAYVRDCLKDASGIDIRGRWAESKALKEFFREYRYPIIFDEAQHGLTDKGACIEYLRAITDHAEVPLVLVCHTSEAKRFSKHDHQATRIGVVCELEIATLEDCAQYIDELAEVEIAADLRAEIHRQSNGRYRLMKDAVTTVEQYAAKMGKSSISLDDARGVKLCEDLQKKLEMTK